MVCLRGKEPKLGPDGREYIGEWKDRFISWFQGSATRNNDKYIGEFKDGKPHGQGTLYFYR